MVNLSREYIGAVDARADGHERLPDGDVRELLDWRRVFGIGEASQVQRDERGTLGLAAPAARSVFASFWTTPAPAIGEQPA
jgi:hypothetical protein